MAETKPDNVSEIQRDTSGGKTGGDDREEEARLHMGGFRHNHTAEPVDAADDDAKRQNESDKTN
jgi:hypothetical protein